MARGSANTLVAKFGGTSMARPEIVSAQLEYEQNAVDVVVVSAAGKDPDYPVGTTNMLFGYKSRTYSAEDIQNRFRAAIVRSGQDEDLASLQIVSQIPQDLSEWASQGNPVNALGEYWSAKLFALKTGREFIDAREIILFDNNGDLNEVATFAAIQDRIDRGHKYVVPGYYGSSPDGKIVTFDRGGSDISGAIIAKALEADAYHNWSDVPGFMTADPRIVEEARLLSRITYREARELGNGGSQLLHRTVIKYLRDTGIKTIMRQTFGALGNSGTEIVDNRAWQWQPIIGVTGRADLIALNLHEFGLNEGIGETVDVIQSLKDAKIPYEHNNDATDDVATYIDRKHKQGVEAIASSLRRPGRTLVTNNAGLIHIVGEGLAQSNLTRVWSLGSVCIAFYNAALEGRGVTDLAGSATQTLFVRPQALPRAINLAHQALNLDKIK